MRNLEVDEIISLLDSKETIFIFGDEGYGKTSVLKSINQKLENSFYFELISISKLTKFLSSLAGINERSVLDSIQKLNSKSVITKKIVILIDNYNCYDSRFKKYLNLINCKKIIASIKREKGFSYELLPISFERSVEYAQNLLGDYTLSRGVSNSSGGNLAKLVLLTEEVKHKNKKEAIKFLKSCKPELKRKPIIKMKYVFVAIYFLLFMRFVFYLNNNFREGFILASIGYFLMIVTRLGRN